MHIRPISWPLSSSRPRSTPPTGVTESLIGSGRVELLPPELRVRLTGWPAAIEDALEEQLNLVRLGEERLRPTLNASATDLEPAYDRAAEWGRNRTGIVREGDGVTQLVMSSEFRNLLLERQKVIDNAASEIESLRGEARNIAALIERSR